MEKITYLPNGQWKLEKGSMKRLAPKAQGREHQFWDEAVTPAEDPAVRKRGQVSLVKQHIGNPHAFKTIDGKPHIMLHRGITDYKENGKMKVDDTSLSHEDHGLYTDHHEYAKQFANSGKLENTNDPHSVWVPIDNISSNAHHEHESWLKSQSNVPEGKSQFDNMEGEDGPMSREEALEMYDGEYGEAMNRGNHIAVAPGKYLKASKDEVSNYLKFHQPGEPNKSMVKPKE